MTVFDKTFTRTGWLGDPTSVSVTPRHLAVGTAEIVVPADHRLLPQLTADGARITIDQGDEQVLSGPIRGWSGTGPTSAGEMVFTVEDDLRLLWNLYGYPDPGAAITAQPLSDERTGPAETVVKGYIAANVARWSRPYTVAPNLGRGSSVTLSVRMLPLSDVLLPAIDQAGIGVTVRQVGTGLVVDCYAPSLYPQTLSEEGGTVIAYSLTQTPFTATRAIVGGPNVGTSREWRLVVDTAREAQYGDVIESLVDATDEVTPTKILAKGAAALADAGPTYAFSVQLSETSIFKYGGTDGLHVGDRVAVELNPGTPPITDVLREATLSWNRDDGYQASLQIGTDEGSADKALASILDQLAKGIRSLRSR